MVQNFVFIHRINSLRKWRRSWRSTRGHPSLIPRGIVPPVTIHLINRAPSPEPTTRTLKARYMRHRQSTDPSTQASPKALQTNLMTRRTILRARHSTLQSAKAVVVTKLSTTNTSTSSRPPSSVEVVRSTRLKNIQVHTMFLIPRSVTRISLPKKDMRCPPRPGSLSRSSRVRQQVQLNPPATARVPLSTQVTTRASILHLRPRHQQL